MTDTKKLGCTPGPWRFEMNRQETEGNVYGSNDDCVFNCDLGGTFQYGGREEWETEIADHRLAAAAPTMFDALLAVQDAPLSEELEATVFAALKLAREGR